MNLYFLVEGERTEKKVYPKFLDYFFEGKITRVYQFYEVHRNNYFLLEGKGYPQIFNKILKNSIQDINSTNSYNYLFFCIDAEENTVKEREEELKKHLQDFKKKGIELNDKCTLEIIVQNRCIETWFLGNKRVYKTHHSNERLRNFQNFYNVKDYDPELMPTFNEFENHANFHEAYLKQMLKEVNVRYTKKYPREVAEKHYLEELIKRGNEDKHLASFMKFYNICLQIKSELK